ncbi:GNAT family N-acetyltransferase [Gryllotalpicola protaetiae]|uniref:GNAT family N-acetyltransferase n=1 Tax=Gryllotalpicola protaetiae TaxID=2419771 RepID=A0A387BUJ1_9MICO|nr:GNAT family N-acetyltransferase [Gryllotalpicola protaetiae]AYG04669.1 GNAT family N-acetyltransferase [Gryllotalpicola protaetiae]
MTAAEVEETADGLLSAFRWLAERLPAGWSRTEGRSVAAVTGLPAPVLNGVWSAEAHADPQVLAELVGVVSAAGLPWSLQSPSHKESMGPFAHAQSLVATETIPLMRVERRPWLRATPGLTMRRLETQDAALHARLASLGYPAPAAVFEPLASAELAETGDIGYFVGEVEGEPVATALGLMLEDHVGIFDVATLPEYRRRGFGAALTAAVIDDAMDRGAGWAWLQSSPAGFGVYESLGFRTVSEWTCWAPA